MAPSTPAMLPSYNQIGYDSLHYILGAVEGDGNNAILWGIGGKLSGDNKTVINPELQVRFPLMMNYDNGLLTFYNYDGMLLDMNGSWAMPLALFRVATIVNPASGAGLAPAELNAIAECDKIKFYGNFMKLMGMSDFSTGLMNIYGGINFNLFGSGKTASTPGAGKVYFSFSDKTVSANFDIFPCHCITAKERAGAYFGAPVDNSSCCNVTVIFNDGIMFYKGFSIDDAILANFCACIDQGMMHDDGALGNLGMRGDVSKG